MIRRCDRCGVDCARAYVRVEQQCYTVGPMDDTAHGAPAVRAERILCLPCTRELAEWVRTH